jgi:hypothetical protein
MSKFLVTITETRRVAIDAPDEETAQEFVLEYPDLSEGEVLDSVVEHVEEVNADYDVYENRENVNDDIAKAAENYYTGYDPEES